MNFIIYFAAITVRNITQIRTEFLRKLFELNSSFSTFDHSSIFHYLISMKDKTINLSSSFVYQVMNVYDDKLKS